MSQEKRERILEIVNTPITFFVLLLLIGETFFVLAYFNSQEPHKTFIMWAFIGVFLLFIILISLMSINYPGALYGKNLAEENKRKEDFHQQKLKYLEEKISLNENILNNFSKNYFLRTFSLILSISVPSICVSLYFLIYTFGIQTTFNDYKYDTFLVLDNLFHYFFYSGIIFLVLVLSFLRRKYSLLIERASQLSIVAFSVFWLFFGAYEFGLQTLIKFLISFLVSFLVYIFVVVDFREILFERKFRVILLSTLILSLLILSSLIYANSTFDPNIEVELIVFNETDKNIFILNKYDKSIDELDNDELIDSLFMSYGSGIPVDNNILSDIPVTQKVRMLIEVTNQQSDKKEGYFILKINSSYLMSTDSIRLDLFLDKFNNEVDFIPPFPNSVRLHQKIEDQFEELPIVELEFSSYIPKGEEVGFQLEFLDKFGNVEFLEKITLQVKEKSKSDYFENFILNKKPPRTQSKRF